MDDRTEAAENNAEELLSLELNSFIENTQLAVNKWLTCLSGHDESYRKLDQLKSKQVTCYERWPTLFTQQMKAMPMFAVALRHVAALLTSIDTIQGVNEYAIIYGFDDELLKRQSIFNYWKKRLETSDTYEKEVARSHGLRMAK